ncbi:MAG: metal-dependent hydrolase [Oceanococcaceae bacterium]
MSVAKSAGVSEHPMDDFPVRPLEFDFSKIRFGDPVWSRSSPGFSMFINALGVHVPYFERYLVKAMSVAKKQISDPQLLRDVGAIIGQEAHHAKNFLGFNRWMGQRYPRLPKIDADARDYFAQHAKDDDLKRLIGFTAGYETFTFLAGIIILENFDRWMKRGDPVMKAVWIWHQVEEVEHGAVAFDVYRALFGKHEWYRKWMVLFAAGHIAKETIKAYAHMTAVEYGWRRPFRALRSMGFCFYMLGRLATSALPVFKGSYHPKQHPLVTNRQNSIQVAWRRYEHEGGNVLEIDRHKMAEIMGVPLAA